jgi:hypothetical protein
MLSTLPVAGCPSAICDSLEELLGEFVGGGVVVGLSDGAGESEGELLEG